MVLASERVTLPGSLEYQISKGSNFSTTRLNAPSLPQSKENFLHLLRKRNGRSVASTSLYSLQRELNLDKEKNSLDSSDISLKYESREIKDELTTAILETDASTEALSNFLPCKMAFEIPFGSVPLP